MLSELGGGDYGHAGDIEAIDIVLAQVHLLAPHLKNPARGHMLQLWRHS